MAIGCQACVESCEACIAECEKLNDPGMSEVIASLRKCAQSCRELINPDYSSPHGTERLLMRLTVCDTDS